eukprot:gnl/MRDRNA2_/MRDRNA2_139947_c0_seq1.p1 gnl/MRDRNA2_/MRDRNA2_139947_c0~~gnl/MRDRNA2_/MRDRNA2_139947_c0_seq1.p1  ORF type:complete len:229 (-),score=48.64 gnl/MRDRNA2_/MRDRNA2_139947_c0_seq1:75-761(-)
MLKQGSLTIAFLLFQGAEAGRKLRTGVKMAANATSSIHGPKPAPGGPVAVQIDWLIERGMLKDLQGAISDKCETDMKEALALSSVQHSLETPQKAEDSFACLNMRSGRVCHSQAIYSEDPEWHDKRKSQTQFTIWDLNTGWTWCLPKDCADTDDLRKIASFMRMRIHDLAKPETAPLAIRTSLMIDCQESGGGYVYVDYNDKWTFKSASSYLLPGAVCFASMLFGLLF